MNTEQSGPVAGRARRIAIACLVVLASCEASVPARVHAAATLIPDHTFRLGSCGGPDGAACSWECGQGKGCAGGGQCALEGGSAFGVTMVAKADAAPCGAAAGSVLTIGLAGVAGGQAFALADTAFDLCGRDIACSGREPRACAVCGDDDPAHLLCASDDDFGNYPCPPGNVVFFCKDPCAGGGPGFEHFGEADLDIFSAWFSETRQPLPEVIRAALPSAPAVGRPVVYFAKSQLFPTGDPPRTRVCARVFYTSQEKSLGVCSNDAQRICGSDAECGAGASCLSGTPDAVNPPAPDAVVAPSVCTGGTRAGKPCATATDCGAGGSCAALAASASNAFCSGSFTACTSAAQCPSGETCDSCPQPACGDGVVDPGEACDDGNAFAGDGCDGACRVEPCFTCDRELGEQSLCAPDAAGTTCDVDGTACTRGTCDGSGACFDGNALTGCGEAVPTKAKLKLQRDPVAPAKAKLAWKWQGAGAFSIEDLGAPAATQGLCVFDRTGLRFDLAVPGGGLCAGKACWSVKPTKAQYKDRLASSDGVTKLAAASGAPGKGKLQLTAKGAALELPLPLVPPVRAVAVTTHGTACVEATYSTPAKNDGVRFDAKGD